MKFPKSILMVFVLGLVLASSVQAAKSFEAQVEDYLSSDWKTFAGWFGRSARWAPGIAKAYDVNPNGCFAIAVANIADQFKLDPTNPTNVVLFKSMKSKIKGTGIRVHGWHCLTDRGHASYNMPEEELRDAKQVPSKDGGTLKKIVQTTRERAV